MEQSELVRRLQEGDDGCLADIRAELGPWVLHKLRQRFGSGLSNEDIDDAISVGLDRLWLNRHRYDPDLSKLSTWFYLIVRNVAIDLIRERLARESPAHSISAPLANRSLTDHQKAIVTKYLQSLSEEDQCILRTFAESSSHGHWAKEAAAMLGKSAGAIRVRKLRLIEKIEKLLE
ncbi:MAG: sigma-70 family RNA polymerase sigma factor [Planctomycetota bacterium]